MQMEAKGTGWNNIHFSVGDSLECQPPQFFEAQIERLAIPDCVGNRRGDIHGYLWFGTNLSTYMQSVDTIALYTHTFVHGRGFKLSCLPC